MHVQPSPGSELQSHPGLVHLNTPGSAHSVCVSHPCNVLNCRLKESTCVNYGPHRYGQMMSLPCLTKCSLNTGPVLRKESHDGHTHIKFSVYKKLVVNVSINVLLLKVSRVKVSCLILDSISFMMSRFEMTLLFSFGSVGK